MSYIVACVNWHTLIWLWAIELQATACLQEMGSQPVGWRHLEKYNFWKPKPKLSKLITLFFFTGNEGASYGACWTDSFVFLSESILLLLWSGRAVADGTMNQLLWVRTPRWRLSFPGLAPCLSAACRMLDITARRESCGLLSMKSLVFRSFILLFLEEVFLSTGGWCCSDDTCLAQSQTLWQ